MKVSLQKERTQPQERHILYGIIAILCLAPLPLGSARPVPIAIITACVGLLSIYWGKFAANDAIFIRVSLRQVKYMAAAIAVVFIWSIVQVIPFNMSIFSSEFWIMAQQLLPNADIKSSISVNRHEAWVAFYKMLSYVMIFWLSLQICRSGNNAKKLLRVLSWSGAAYATYGLALKAFGSQKILWFYQMAYVGSLSSTFVNRNNYATYAGIVLIISLALFINRILENIASVKRKDLYNQIMLEIFTKGLPSLIGIFIIAASLVLSNSRAGIGASVLGLATFILLSALTGAGKKHRKTFIALLFVVISIVLMLFKSGGDIVASRLNTLQFDAELRGNIYSSTIDAISDAPLKGAGLGSFTDIFKAYKNASLPAWFDALTDYAHNSYLELTLELGIPAFLLLLMTFIVIWLRCCSGMWNRRKNGYIPAISVSVAVLVATHALFDFSAQIPAVMLIFTVLIAVGLAQSWSVQEDISGACKDEGNFVLYNIIATKASIFIGCVLVLSSVWQIYAVFSSHNPDTYKNNAIVNIEAAKNAGVLTSRGKTLLHEAEVDIGNSLKLQPIDSYAWTYLAYVKLLGGASNGEAVKLLAASIVEGLNDVNLGFFRLTLIPVLWEDAGVDEKALFASQIKTSWAKDSAKTVQVMSSPFSIAILHEQIKTMPDASAELEKFRKLTGEAGLQP